MEEDKKVLDILRSNRGLQKVEANKGAAQCSLRLVNTDGGARLAEVAPRLAGDHEVATCFAEVAALPAEEEAQGLLGPLVAAAPIVANLPKKNYNAGRSSSPDGGTLGGEAHLHTCLV